MAAAISIEKVKETLTRPQGRLPRLAEEPLESPSLLQRLAYLIGNPLKNRILRVSRLKKMLGRSRSRLIAESFVRPGGWRSMELVYRNAPPVDWFDRQALVANPISMAARNRRKIVTDLLTKLIRKHASHGPVTMLGVGAGPGWHLQTAMVDSELPADRVSAWLIDLDDDAFPFGRAIAQMFGIENSVHFIQGDASRISEVLPDTRFQIVKLIGIIEYLNDEQLTGMLTAIHSVMVPGATLVTHGLEDKYHTGPFLSRVFALKHHQRDAKRLREILTQTGFRVESCEYEPTGIHPIVTAVKP